MRRFELLYDVVQRQRWRTRLVVLLSPRLLALRSAVASLLAERAALGHRTLLTAVGAALEAIPSRCQPFLAIHAVEGVGLRDWG